MPHEAYPVDYYPTLVGDFIICQMAEDEFRVGIASSVSRDFMLKTWRPLSVTDQLFAREEDHVPDRQAYNIPQTIMDVTGALRDIKLNRPRDFDLPDQVAPFVSLQEVLTYIESYVTDPPPPPDVDDEEDATGPEIDDTSEDSLT